MRPLLLVLGLQAAALPAERTPRADPELRWAYVSVYVTIPDERARRRIKVVSSVFPLCDGGELPSAVFAGLDSTLRAAVRRVTHAPFTITHRGLEVRTSRDSAESARARGLHDERFALTVPAAAGAVRCCCARATRP